MLRYTFQRDCRNLLNNIVVTHKVSYSNSNDWHEFLWTWNVSISVNKIFPLYPKMSLHFKAVRCFWLILYSSHLL
jgi:hypothetical protein